MSETVEQMEGRLLGVISQSRFELLPDDYVWAPMNLGHAPAREAIACVRDGDTWSQFIPASSTASSQRYRVVSFYFKEGTNASGFVAWLAAHLKRSAGTGSVVICGKDRRDSPELFQTSLGVFDYWCCPVAAGDKFVAVVRSLIEQGRARDARALLPNP
jgi:hypothetical protein